MNLDTSLCTENVLNRDEFDGDADAGVFNPVVLPWKNRGEKS
jgi:hypothetical protein